MTREVCFEIALSTAGDTRRLGFELASLVQRQAIVALTGPLGAGKTTFAQGAGEALGISEAINSPTFTTINEYTSGRLPFYHLDLYRFHDSVTAGGAHGSAAIDEIALEMDELIAAPGLVLIEWPEPLNGLLAGRDQILVTLNYLQLQQQGSGDALASQESGRVARISAVGEQTANIVERAKNIYFS